nr:hypothetical protein [Tanacetum cinerariifolium]
MITYLEEALEVGSIRRIQGIGYGILEFLGDVGFHVVDSHTDNHPEDGFTPLETIRRSYSVIKERISFELKGDTFEPERRGTSSIPPVECNAYGGDPSVDLLRSFLNLGRAGDRLTLSNRGGADVPKALIKPELMVSSTSFPRELRGQSSNTSFDDELPQVHPLHLLSLRWVSKAVRKRKLDVDALREVSHRRARRALVHASKVAGDASTPLDVDSDPDIHEFPYARELKDAIDYYWVVAHVTHPSWKHHLRDIIIEQLCDIHDRAYMRQAILDNMWNSRTRELISALHKARASCLESERERLKASEIQMLQEINRLRQDRAAVVSRVVPGTAMKLVHSNDMGFLVARLVTETIIHGRCMAFKEIAKLKEPFIFKKMLGYHMSSKDEYDRAGEDMANASFPFLSEFTSNPYASVEQLLSIMPRSIFEGYLEIYPCRLYF